MLKDKLYSENWIIINYYLNFTDKGKEIIKDISNEKQNINYSNLVFKSGNPDIKNFDFLTRFGTLYDLLTSLLNKKVSINREIQEQEKNDKQNSRSTGII